MGDRLKYERFIWFHNLVKAHKYPNTRHLCEEFEISARTAHRDIEFMRERVGAPLVYTQEQKGFYYSEQSFELPGIWFTEDIIVALALAVRLASSVPDKLIKDSLCAFLDELLDRSRKGDLCLEDISEKISVKNIEYSKAAGAQFHIVTNSLFEGSPLEITYHSPHTSETTRRKIMPLHLLLYMGSWHIIAYCASKKGLRDFVISRIRSAEPIDEGIPLPSSLPSVKVYIRKNFGIMQGGRQSLVKLKFSPDVSRWVSEQVWHPSQKAALSNDSILTLQFPVADFREIRRKILSYGSDIKVISPKSLADDIKAEIRKMAKIY